MRVTTVLLIEGSVNVIICLSKFAVGTITNSSAILADAVHSLTDVINNGVAWLAARISNTKPDKEHPYGHRKFEFLAVFFLASLLLVVAVEVVIHAIERFGTPVKQNNLGLLIMAVTLVINICLALWENHWARKLGSQLLGADATHTLSDILTTIIVIIAWQISSYGFYWIDLGLAVVVSCVIMVLAAKLFWRAIPALVDQTHLDSRNITPLLERIEGVHCVRRFRSRFNGDIVVADMTVGVDGDLSTNISHNIAKQIEKVMADKFNVHDVVVSIEPYQKARD